MNDYAGKGRPRIAWIKPGKKLFYFRSRESFLSDLIRQSDIMVAIQKSDLCNFETFCDVNFFTGLFVRKTRATMQTNQNMSCYLRGNGLKRAHFTKLS